MNRMLIFSVHLKGTKESDIGCALVKRESRSADLIQGLLVWQRIQFIAKQILLVNSSSSNSFFVTEKMHKPKHILFI